MPEPTCPHCQIELTRAGSSWFLEYDVATNCAGVETGHAAKRYVCARCGLLQFYSFVPSELPSSPPQPPSGLLPRK